MAYTMRKYIIIGGFLVFVVILIILALLFRSSPETNEVIPSPAPEQMAVELLETVPTDGAASIKLTQEIVLTFNEPVTKNDITILVGPKTELFEAFRGKTVILRPRSQWTPGVENRITIQYADLSRIPASFAFTTVGDAPDTLPDTAPDPTQIQQSKDFQRNARPDVYLAGFVPYDADNFTITAEFVNTPTGHFAFTVVSKGNAPRDQLEREVEAWMRGHALTDAQIQTIDISYQ